MLDYQERMFNKSRALRVAAKKAVDELLAREKTMNNYIFREELNNFQVGGTTRTVRAEHESTLFICWLSLFKRNRNLFNWYWRTLCKSKSIFKCSLSLSESYKYLFFNSSISSLNSRISTIEAYVDTLTTNMNN